MIVPYIRSSSYSTHEGCGQQYFIGYNLGIPQKANIKAQKGNVVHKALECLALLKKAQQDGKDRIYDEVTGELSIGLCYVENLVGIAYNHYRNESPELPWGEADREECLAWTYKALKYNRGLFDPRERNIVNPEIHFDLEIDKPWAEYSYNLPDGSKLEGKLHLKGTIDLVTELEPGILEIVDWKTGRRLDWNTMQEKTYGKLAVDPQLRMYYYAARKLFPEVEQIIVTIFYINDGGAYSICFEDRDIEATELMLKKKFEQINKEIKPKLNISRKCWTICSYGPKGGTYKLPDGTDTGLTICQYMKRHVEQKGVFNTMKEHTHPGFKLNVYQDGGGKSAEQRHGT